MIGAIESCDGVIARIVEEACGRIDAIKVGV
jgi:hypothetical protein